jgi:hypothetical protein
MMSNPKSEELLPPAAAGCAAGVRLEKSQEINIINRRGRSTHPKEKSVLRSGATPVREIGAQARFRDFLLHRQKVGLHAAAMTCKKKSPEVFRPQGLSV